MNWKEIYQKVVKNICEKKVDPQANIYEPQPPKALLEGKTYTVEGDGLINIRLDEKVATDEDYKDFCRFAFEKIGESLEDYIGQEKKFSNFSKQQEQG